MVPGTFAVNYSAKGIETHSMVSYKGPRIDCWELLVQYCLFWKYSFQLKVMYLITVVFEFFSS